MKRANLMAALGVVGILAVLGVGCGSGDDDAAPNGDTDATPSSVLEAPSAAETGFFGVDQSAGTPKSGGVLRSATGQGEPLGLDPVRNTTDGLLGMSEYAAIYDVLVTFDPLENSYVPQLASDLTADASYTAWTIGLRPGVKFTDGTDLDAEAVKFNLERYSGPDSIQYYYYETPNIVSIDTPDAQTVVVNLATPDPQFPWFLTQGMGLIGSPTAIKADSAAFNLNPVGAGPFKVSKYTPGDSLELVRNDDYWDGPAYLDGVTFSWPVDDSTRMEALQSGDLDLALVHDATIVSDAVSSDLSGFVQIRYLGEVVAMNGREGHPAEDQRVRQAIAFALDADAMDDRLNGGNGLPSKALFPSGPLKTTTEPLAYDRERAAALVAEAKESSDWDGSIAILTSGDADSQATAIAVQAQLEAAGFDVTIDLASSTSAFTQSVYVNFDYDLAVTGVVVTPSNPWAQLVSNVSGPYSTFGQDVPGVAAALTDLRAAADPEATTAALDKLQTAWNEEQPAAVFSVAQYTSVWTSKLRGVEPSSNNALLLGKAWLSEE